MLWYTHVEARKSTIKIDHNGVIGWVCFRIRSVIRFRANSAHIRQSRPDSGLDLSYFRTKDLKTIYAVPFSLENGHRNASDVLI